MPQNWSKWPILAHFSYFDAQTLEIHGQDRYMGARGGGIKNVKRGCLNTFRATPGAGIGLIYESFDPENPYNTFLSLKT